MPTFKIRDLIVTVEPGSAGARPLERHRTVAEAHAEVPTGPGAPGYFACGASPEPDVVIGVSPHEVIEDASAEELLLLKKQLQDLLTLVERRENELGQGTGKAVPDPSQKDLKGWESRLSKALTGVRSMMAKRSKAAKKAKKSRAKKAGRSRK